MAKWLLLNDTKAHLAGETFDDLQMKTGFVASMQASGAALIDITNSTPLQVVADTVGALRQVGRATAAEIQATLLALVVASGSTGGFIDSMRLAAFGTGVDGDSVISAGVTTQPKEAHFRNLTILGTGSLDPNCSIVRVFDTFDASNAPQNAIANPVFNGNAGAAAGTGGTASSSTPQPAIGKTLGGSFRSIVGGAGGTANGTAAGNATAQASCCRAGSLGSKGGDSGGNTGGNAGNADTTAASINCERVLFDPPTTQVVSNSSGAAGTLMGGRSGSSGGGGAGDGTAGGGGGSGGGGSPPIFLYCRRLKLGPGTAAGFIAAFGGGGGNGGSPAAGARGGGGAGAGGGGGPIYLMYEELIYVGGSVQVLNAITAPGGTGGTGGTGTGAAAGAPGGQGGPGGEIFLVDLKRGTVIPFHGTAGAAGNANVGATGGTGGIGGTCTAPLGVAA